MCVRLYSYYGLIIVVDFVEDGVFHVENLGYDLMTSFAYFVFLLRRDVFCFSLIDILFWNWDKGLATF